MSETTLIDIVLRVIVIAMFAGAGFYSAYFLVLRNPLAEARKAVDAASSVGDSLAFTPDRAATVLKRAERLTLWIQVGAASLGAGGFAFDFQFPRNISYPAPIDILMGLPLTEISTYLLAFVSGMFLRGMLASLEIGRAKLVLDARSKLIASIGEDRVGDATVLLHARSERDEQRFRQNLSAAFELKYFELHDANIFRDLSWNLEPQINVLLGRNGFGKSFLLRLLVGMVSYDNDRLSNLLSTTSGEQRLAVQLLRDEEPVTIERGPVAFGEAVGKIPVLAIPDSRFINRARESIGAEGDEYVDLARYGAHRFLYELSYDTTIQTVLAQMCIEVMKGGSIRGRPTSPQLDLVSEVIRELSGERFRFHRIEPIGGARFSIQVETDSSPGRPISIQQASQGTLSVVAVYGLIYQYLRAVHPSVGESELCKQRAIIIIDEVDAHLHPAWQRKITHLLRRHFPNIQFILTAHSPLVVAGCGHGEVAVLRRKNEDLEIVDFQKDFIGATAKDIYRDVFEIEDRDAKFLELQAELPRLPGRLRELEWLRSDRSTDPARIRSAEDTIRSIERTREEQETKLSYEALERENAQLRRQLEALRKRNGPGVA